MAIIWKVSCSFKMASLKQNGKKSNILFSPEFKTNEYLCHIVRSFVFHVGSFYCNNGHREVELVEGFFSS